MKEARDAYRVEDYPKAEAALFTPEVFKNSQNRLQHYYFLSSLAMSQGQFEKALFFLNRARDIANQVRSNSGSFEWFSSDYLSNPIEYSYIHSMLVMCYSLLAEGGESPTWSLPQIKDDHGNVMVEAQTHAARKFAPKEISDFRQRARSELLAWDSFLENLKRTYPTEKYYKEDLWSRILASYVHGISSDRNERRTAELLTDTAKEVFDKEFTRFPAAKVNGPGIQDLLARLKKRAQNKNSTDSLFVLEAGVMPKYKMKRFHLGLSTLFKNIENPGLRRLAEEIGIRVLLLEAPEFGLIAVGGAVAGAASGDSGGGRGDDEFEGPPSYFSDAIDQSLGFEIRFPTLVFPPSDTSVTLELTSPGHEMRRFALPIVSPLQEIIASELKSREDKEMFGKALKIGAQYLAILIPAIKGYQSAGKEGNIFKKIAVLAGYFIAKKVIDRANTPDLRSWSLLPQFIAADLISVAPGDYDAKVVLTNQFGKEERTIGKLNFGAPNSLVLRHRIGNVPGPNVPTAR